MKTSELFRKTLKKYLDMQGHGAQARLADSIGEDRKNLNAFLNGRKMFSEVKREYIAVRLGFSYIDFLLLGRQMIEKEESDTESSYDESEVDYLFPADKNCMYSLADVIGIFEESIAKMFEPEISVKLSVKIKARTIINMYNSYIKRVSYSIAKPYPIDIKILIDVIELVESESCGEDCDPQLKAEKIATAYIDIMKAKQSNKSDNQEDDDKHSALRAVINRHRQEMLEGMKHAA